MPDYTILLIDYDPRSIERTTGLLVGAGYRVEVAKNGIEGLDAFKRKSPGLVLVEAMLPKKHGFEVCQEIKQSPEGANVPVVIFTAVYKGRKYRSQAFHLYKCDDYLEKPVPDAKLLEAIGKLLPIGSKPESAPPKPATPPAPATAAKAAPVAAKTAPAPPASPPKAPEPVKAPAVAAKTAPAPPASPPKAPEPVKAPAVAAKTAPAPPVSPAKAPEPVKAPAVAAKTAPAPPASPPKAPEPVKAPAVAAKTAPAPPVSPPKAPAVAAKKAPEAAPTAEAATPPAPPRAEPAAAKPAEPAKPAKPRPKRPRRDEPIAQFTEDDIMSTLDAIMPDEPAPDKTAAS